MSAIRRDFLPDDLQPLLAQHGVDGCIAVQADQTLSETDFLLDLADGHDWIRGIVGWVDLRAADLENHLDRYAERKQLKGFRHFVQGEADPLFMLRPEFLRGIDQLGQRGYTYDILIFPHQLVAALELVKLFPDQKFVLDHLAKPYAKAGYFTGWAAGLAAIARLPNVYCKLSGLITEADYRQWTVEGLLPYLRHALDVFGPQRCMFGSDWPVCLVAGDYGQALRLLETALQDYGQTEREALFGDNGAHFYGV